jgi:ribosomal protein L15E
MKKLFAVLVIAIGFATIAAAQVNLDLGGLSGNPAAKKPKPTSKTVTGTVSDKSDQPIANAVVYLKNAKTLVVKSFFTQDNGTYRFPQVALNTDYEVWAEKDGKKSAMKGVSQFDDRFTPTINLQIDLNK